MLNGVWQMRQVCRPTIRRSRVCRGAVRSTAASIRRPAADSRPGRSCAWCNVRGNPSSTVPPPASTRSRTMSVTIRSGTNSPRSTNVLASRPSSVSSRMCARNRSPLATWVRPACSASTTPCVPFPTPGEPISTMSMALHPLEDRGDALAATDAHGDECVLAPGAPQLVERLDGEDRPRGADRVAERDTTAVGVRPLGGKVELAHDSQRLRRERLVHLEQIDLVDLQAGLVQYRTDGGHGTHAHDPWLHAGVAVRHQASDRSQPARVGEAASASITAAAASFTPDALPAVTVPPSAKAGRNLARSAIVTPGRTCSSAANCTTPFRVATST